MPTRTRKFTISHRHSSGIPYAVDLSLWNGRESKKLLSMKYEEGMDISIMSVIQMLLEEGIMEIHGIPINTSGAMFPTERLDIAVREGIITQLQYQQLRRMKVEDYDRTRQFSTNTTKKLHK